jgi:hypothetical protein
MPLPLTIGVSRLDPFVLFERQLLYLNMVKQQSHMLLLTLFKHNLNNNRIYFISPQIDSRSEGREQFFKFNNPRKSSAPTVLGPCSGPTFIAIIVALLLACIIIDLYAMILYQNYQPIYC